jgi:uncharacterized membrane protein YecN with MAPEG domain
VELVAIVVALALLEYMFFALQVGRGRGKYGVAAPAISGHPTFERLYRVQLNTLEQLIVFVPAVWLFATFVSAPTAAAVGLVFVVGRALYYSGYVKDPAKRGPGFLLGFVANVVLVLGSLIGAALQVG